MEALLVAWKIFLKIKGLSKIMKFLKNADYGRFESLRTRLSTFEENFKNAN